MRLCGFKRHFSSFADSCFAFHSWLPAVYPQYRVQPDVTHRFGFWMLPLTDKYDDAALSSRGSFPTVAMKRVEGLQNCYPRENSYRVVSPSANHDDKADS